MALVVAPLLAVLAWYFVGQLSAQKAQPAQAGQSYPLLEKSNCRYASGVCAVENAEVKASLTFRDDAEGGFLVLSATHPLSGALVSVGSQAAFTQPQAMTSSHGIATQWIIPLSRRPEPPSRIRLVLSVAGSAYYAEVSTAFLQSP